MRTGPQLRYPTCRYLGGRVKTIAVVPTFHEEDSIQSLVKSLYQHVDGVILADESTNDLTARAGAKAGATILQTKGGIGPSLLSGFRLALSHEPSHIAVIDAGGSHQVSDLPRLLAQDVDVVIGSRFVRGAVYKGRAWRARMSRLYGSWWSLKTSQRIHDWTSGYRVYRADVLDKVLDQEYRATMHAFQAELLAALVMRWAEVVEVPIHYQAGTSAMSPRVAWEAVRVAL